MRPKPAADRNRESTEETTILSKSALYPTDTIHRSPYSRQEYIKLRRSMKSLTRERRSTEVVENNVSHAACPPSHAACPPSHAACPPSPRLRRVIDIGRYPSAVCVDRCRRRGGSSGQRRGRTVLVRSGRRRLGRSRCKRPGSADSGTVRAAPTLYVLLYVRPIGRH